MNGKFVFRGFGSSVIFWDDTIFQWRLENSFNDINDPTRIFTIPKMHEHIAQ